jgi:hypothetical protein
MAVRLSQMCCPINTSTSPAYTDVIYATSVLFKDFRSHPLTMCVSQLLVLPNNCPMLKILGFYPQPSFQGQPVTSPQLEVVREGIPPTESRDGPPPLPPKTGPLARFRWQKQLSKTPKMFLSVVRTSGWVFKVCWVDFRKF